MFKLKIINKPKMIKMKCNIEFPDVVLANLQDKETTPTKETQVVVADFPFDGLSKVTVNPIPDEYIIPNGEIEINANGTYDVSDKASAKVNVPEKQLGTKTITTNGTYNASDDNLDGYSEVEVNISKYAPRKIQFGGYKGTELDYEIENLDTSRITNCDSMFSTCQNLKQIKSFDTSNVTSMRTFVYYCNELSEFPLFDMSKVSDFTQAMYNCNRIKKIPKLNFQSITGLFQTFYGCKGLTDLGGFENLGQAYPTTQSANYYKLDLSSSTKLTEQSIINVLNNLYDIATKGVKPQQVTLGATNLAKLTSEEGQQALASSTEKGWSIS